MPLDPQFRTVLDTLQDNGMLPLVRDDDALLTRAHYQQLSMSRRGPGYLPEQVASATDQRSPGGVPVRIFEPLPPNEPDEPDEPDEPNASTIVYLHGGGWVVGNVGTHDPLCRRVANATGARVVSVDYRLAPEHPYPAALDDAEEVLRWQAAEHPGRPLGVAGDSAGASLSAGLAIRARDKQLPLTAQLLLYPAIDPAMSSPSIAENGEGYFLTQHCMEWFYRQYFPAGVPADAEADLARADVTGVVPAVVATAEFDPLRDEGAAYADRLKHAGVQVHYVPGPGLIHGFAGFLGVVDAADRHVLAILDLYSAKLQPSQ
jgi:acetyl esterase